MSLEEDSEEDRFDSSTKKSRKQLLKYLNDNSVEPWTMNQAEDFIQILYQDSQQESEIKLHQKKKTNILSDSTLNQMINNQSNTSFEHINNTHESKIYQPRQNQDIYQQQQQQYSNINQPQISPFIQIQNRSQTHTKGQRQKSLAQSIQIQSYKNSTEFEKKKSQLLKSLEGRIDINNEIDLKKAMENFQITPSRNKRLREQIKNNSLTQKHSPRKQGQGSLKSILVSNDQKDNPVDDQFLGIPIQQTIKVKKIVFRDFQNQNEVSAQTPIKQQNYQLQTIPLKVLKRSSFAIENHLNHKEQNNLLQVLELMNQKSTTLQENLKQLIIQRLRQERMRKSIGSLQEVNEIQNTKILSGRFLKVEFPHLENNVNLAPNKQIQTVQEDEKNQQYFNRRSQSQSTNFLQQLRFSQEKIIYSQYVQQSQDQRNSSLKLKGVQGINRRNPQSLDRFRISNLLN